MAIFKCKMCGGSLEITEGTSVCTCEYCGTEQTLPRLDSDRKANLYDRANHFRRNNDFDKAMGIYEQILNEDNTDSEAYWSLILCRYGIEYVEDPVSHKRIPTVNRAQYTSIYADENYKAAIANADTVQKNIYEQEAKVIDEIQKGILAISEKEEPFDVFICYKETDDSGRRTQDSVLANDLYHQLTQEGFKVFFARITLEDKLGQEYEPYIFAALNSSKVMVVLGTKPDYYNAVWVKNEWTRYLALIKSGEKKMLIPAYKDMDPYDLPEEFSHLQAQDMSKLGFMQDLIRGIKKIIGNDEAPKTTETVVIQQGGNTTNANALLKRGNISLEDRDFNKADDFFEEVLNQDAECAEAYLGKMLAKYKTSNINELINRFIDKYDDAEIESLEACEETSVECVLEKYPVDQGNENKIKIIYTYDRTYESELKSREEQRDSFLKELEEEKLYVRAEKYASGSFKADISRIREDVKVVLEQRVAEARRSDEKAIETIKNAYEIHLIEAEKQTKEIYDAYIAEKEKNYQQAVEEMNKAESKTAYQNAISMFSKLQGYKDSNKLIVKCNDEIKRIDEEERIENFRRKEEAERREKRQRIVLSLTVIFGIMIFLVVMQFVIPQMKYNSAQELMEEGKYEEAIQKYHDLNDYKDAKDKMNECINLKSQKEQSDKYDEAIELMEEGKYEEAIQKYHDLNDYKDAKDKMNECINLKEQSDKYDEAIELMNEGKYKEAYNAFYELGEYEDSSKKLKEMYRKMLKNTKAGDEISFGEYINNTEWIVLEKQETKVLLISKYAIKYRRYNEEYGSTTWSTWSTCSLRKWLNDSYLNSAFNEDEKSRILTTKVINKGNSKYGTNGGSDTEDKVYLLSIDEVNKYFSSDSDRKVTLVDGASVCWWLRSPGDITGSAACVTSNGSVLEYGYYVYTDYVAVRPALWISIE